GRVVRLEQPVQLLAIGNGAAQRHRVAAAGIFGVHHRNVDGNDHRTTRLHQAQVVLQPDELLTGDITEITGAVVEDVVEDDVVHSATVERVVPGSEEAGEGRDRPFRRGRVEVEVVIAHDLEERHAQSGDGALILGIEGEVVRHDVA